MAADIEVRAISDFDDATWNYHKAACLRLSQEGSDNASQLNRDIKPEETAYVTQLFEQLYDEFGQSFINAFRDHFFFQMSPMTVPQKADKDRFTKNEGKRKESEKFGDLLNQRPKYFKYLQYVFWLHDNAITLSCHRGNMKKTGWVEPPSEELNKWIDGIVKDINNKSRKYALFKVGFRHFILKIYQRLVVQIDPFELPLFMTPEIYAEKAPEEIMEEVDEGHDMDVVHMMAWDRTMDLVKESRENKNCVFVFSNIKFWLDQFQATMNVLSLEVCFAPRTILSATDRVARNRRVNKNTQPIIPEVDVSVLENLPNRCNGFANMPAKVKKRETPFWGVATNFKGFNSSRVVNIKIKKAVVSGPELKEG